MAVSSTTSTITYTGNNSTSVAYTIPFYFLQNADIECVLIDSALAETVLTLTSQYTVTGAGEVAGGELLTTTAYDNTYKIRITRKPAYLQPYVLEEGNLNVMKTLETAIDLLVMQVQRLSAETQTALDGKASADGALPVLSGAGSPVATATLPTYVGQHYVDTTNLIIYHSTGSTSTSDWQSLELPTSTSVITTTYNQVNADDILLVDDDTAGGTVTVNLLAASSFANRKLTIKKLGSTGSVVIDPSGAELIDGNASVTLIGQNDTVTIYCNGSAWYIL